MNLPTQPRERRPWPQVAGAICLQLVAWWCVFYATMFLLALAEEARLHRHGVRYRPPEWLDCVNLCQFQVARNDRWAAAVMGFRVSPATAGFVPDVVLFDLERRTASRLGLSWLAPRCIALAPQGDSIAIVSEYVVYVASLADLHACGHEVAGRQARVLHRTQDEGIGGLVFSPDGRQLAIVGVRHTHLLSFPDGRLMCRLVQQDRLAQACFSDDSQYLILFGFNQPLSWHDARSGRLIASRQLSEHEVVATELSEGGTLAAELNADGYLSVWDVATGEQQWRRDVAGAPQYGNERVALSPDGRLLAVACVEGESFQIHFHDACAGVLLGRSPVYEGAFKGLVVAGDHIAYCWDLKGVLHAWDVTRGVELWRFAWPHAATGTHWPLEEPIPCRGSDATAARWFRLHLFASPF
jgi:hypothetical protein